MNKPWFLWKWVVPSVLLLASCAEVVSSGPDAGTGGEGGAGGVNGTGGGGGAGGGGGVAGATPIPAIAFTDSSSNEVKVATKDGDAWSIETVEPAVTVSSLTSIALREVPQSPASGRTGSSG